MEFIISKEGSPLTQPCVSSSFTYEDLQKAFFAGCKFENGERKSWESYNKFTGNQQPNKEMNFETWYEKNYC